VTTYNNEVNLAYPSYGSEYPQFGAWEYYAKNVVMQPNDILSVSYPEAIHINGTLKIVLVRNIYANVLTSSGYPSTDAFVNYRNEQTSEIVVNVFLISQNMQNVMLPITMILSHYETPQWVIFGIGIVLASLAVIPILKSKKLV
jgi:hypothetical protein